MQNGLITGLRHLHRSVGYLLFVIALANVVLALAGAREKAALAAWVGRLSRIGLRMVGGVELIIGIAMWAIWLPVPATAPWIWGTLLLWGAIEFANVRLIKPQVATVLGGGRATSALIIGTFIQVGALTAIIGLMTTR